MIKLKIVVLMIFLSFILLSFKIINENKVDKKNDVHTTSSFNFDSDVSSMKLYFCIEKYSKKYKIPVGYMYSIAYHETRYSGPNDFFYLPKHTSSANAAGPMQVMLSTARFYYPNITFEELNTNIDLNVEISARCLRRWYDMCGDWEKAFGGYATGNLVKSSYSQFVNNKTFEWK